ncbi:MAG: hypothetical protein KGZ30_04390 [Anaplasmataceae bacterium]|nr:hypothetical protein [Anaplasmataceae bacterium]
MSNEIFGDRTAQIHEALEADIERLSNEIGKHKEHPETSHLQEGALVKKSLQTIEGDSGALGGIFSEEFKRAPEEERVIVERLIDQAIHEKSILKANDEARKMGPFVLDAFHDVLTDVITPLLKEKGII